MESRRKNEETPSGLAMSEDAVWKTMSSGEVRGKFLRIHSRGTDGSSGVTSDIEAVVARASGKIVQWRRETDNGE